MKIKELETMYGCPNENFVEVTNKKQAINLLINEICCGWRNGKLSNTGWTILAQLSPTSEKEKQIILVCKNTLLTGK